MLTKSKLPYMLLLIATAAIIWLLVDDSQPQVTRSSPAFEQAIMERLAEMGSRLERLEEELNRVAVAKSSEAFPANDSEVINLRERIIALEEREVSEATSEQSHSDSSRDRQPLRDKVSQFRAAEIEPPAAAAYFQESDNLSPSDKEDFEDVDAIFDSDDLPNTSLSRIDCREGYCQLEYRVNEDADAANKEVEENQLLIKLGEKYGNGTRVHMGVSSADGTKQVYVELAKK